MTDMASKIALVTDSTSDLSEELINKLDVKIIDAYVLFGTENFTSSELSLDDFHSRLAQSTKKNFPKTSQPSGEDFLKLYEGLKSEGYTDVISVHVASKLSGTVNSANVAKGMIEGMNIHIIDSNGVSANLAACVIEARKLIDSEKSVEDVVTTVTEFGLGLTSYFTVLTLDNLVKGGRMSPIRYRLGKLLKIKPILSLTTGAIVAADKTKGVENSRELAYEYAVKGRNSEDAFSYIFAHTREPELAKTYENKIKANFPKSQGHIIEIGMAVGVHTGVGCLLALTYNS